MCSPTTSSLHTAHHHSNSIRIRTQTKTPPLTIYFGEHTIYLRWDFLLMIIGDSTEAVLPEAPLETQVIMAFYIQWHFSSQRFPQCIRGIISQILNLPMPLSVIPTRHTSSIF